MSYFEEVACWRSKAFLLRVTGRHYLPAEASKALVQCFATDMKYQPGALMQHLSEIKPKLSHSTQSHSQTDQGASAGKNSLRASMDSSRMANLADNDAEKDSWDLLGSCNKTM